MTTITESDKVKQAIVSLGEPSANAVIEALNILIPRSVETDRENIQIDNHPELMFNLIKVMDAVNPLHAIIIDKTSDGYTQFILNEWCTTPFIAQSSYTYTLISKSMDNNSLLLATLCLIRNLSFEKTNEMYFAYSCKMIQHFISLLLVSSDHLVETTRYVFDILANLAKHIDISAATRCRTNFYLEDCLEFKNPTSIKLSVSSDMSVETFQDYVYLTHQLLPILMRFLRTSEDRAGIIRALDLCSKLCAVRENYDYLLNCPDEFLQILVDLICYSHTSIDLQSDLLNKIDKMPPVIGPLNDIVDSEVRNLAIDAIFSLVSTVPPLRPRVAAVPNCLRVLQRTICNCDKRELTQKITALLLFLAQHPDNINRFLAMQDSICIAASSDDYVAELVGLTYSNVLSRTLEVTVEPEQQML